MKKLDKLLKIIIAMLLILGGTLLSHPVLVASTNNTVYRNVFNKNDGDNWLKALSYNGQKLPNASNYANMFTTHKIEVQKGDTLTWGIFGKDEYVMELYDENDGFVRRVLSADLQIIESTTEVIGVGGKLYKEVKASYEIKDESCAYARILGNISTMKTFMVFVNLEEGLADWPTEYVPYQKIEENDNPLTNKAALFVGDSIVNAVKDPVKPYYGWAGRIGTSNDMEWKNAGISSATVSTALSSSYPDNRIVNQLIDNKDHDYDYVILHGGMNDSIVEREIGEISDSYDVADFDITTFSGAMEEMIYTAVHEYEGARIGYIVNYATPNSTWGGLSADNGAYFNCAKEICEKWNIPYIDLFDGGVEVDGVYKSYSYDILEMNTGKNLYNADRTEIHIGSKGYDVISPFIEDWMKTLVPYKAPIKPVLEVTFDDETAKDISGRNNHGSLIGDIEFSEGIKGKAIHIQNANTASSSSTAEQFVNFGKPDDLQFGKEDYSILFYYKSKGTDTSDSSIIGNKSWAWGGNEGFALVNFYNRFGLNFTSTGSSRADTEGISITEDQGWHQVAAVFDRSDAMTLYVDGDKVSSKSIQSQAGKSIDKGDFVVGADGIKQYAMEDVYIDELEVYHHAFTKKELDEKYTSEPTAPDTNYDKAGTDFSADDKNLEMINDLPEIPMTLEAWVKFDKNEVGNSSVIMGNYSDYYYGSLAVLNMEVTPYGEPRLYWYADRESTSYKATGVNIYNDVWTHVAITTEADPEKDRNMIFTTYINGDKMHSQSMVCEPMILDQQMHIGEDTRESMFMHGSLADLRIWSTTRTATEIKEQMNTEIASDAEGLLGNWLLDKEENGVYKDHSIQKNDAGSYWIDEDLFKKQLDGYKSIAVIPDTQTLTLLQPNSYKKLTQWMADEKEDYGIEFAIHVGDIVNDREVSSQWNTAVASMKTLEDAGIPFVFSPGNHDTEIRKVDGVWFGVRDTTMMNRYFPYSKYSKEESFGGTFKDGEMGNTYSYFTVNNVEFMVISMEQNPRDEVLEWANKVAAENEDKRIIVSTHEYLFVDGERTTVDTEETLSFIGGSNQGDMLWEKFAKKHKNIAAVICGHVEYPDVLATEAIGDHGNKVQQILADAQLIDKFDINTNGNEGLGMVMMMSFKEGSNEIAVNWYSTVRKQFYRYNNQMTLSMELHEEETNVSLMKKALKSAMNKAEIIMSGKEFNKLTPIVQTMITTSYNEAKFLYDDNATEEEYLKAWEKLAKSLQYADFLADKTQLNALIEVVKRTNLDGYTEDSVRALQDALAASERVYNNQSALQDSINTAYNNLNNALSALVKEQDTNKAVLNHVLEAAKSAMKNEAAYLKNDAWLAFTEAFDAAINVYDDESADQEAVNMASMILADTYASIRLLPDEALLTQLDDFLNTTTSIERTLYSAEDLAFIDETTAIAKAMLDSKEFSEEEFNNFEPKMVKVLDIVANNLVKNEDNTTVKAGRKINQHGDIKTNGIIAKTGDTSNAASIGLLSIVSAAGLYVIRRRKQISKH